jgi:hypothetical protein
VQNDGNARTCSRCIAHTGGRLRLARHARFTEVMVADPDFEIESLRKSAAIVAKHELLMPHELSEVCRHASKPPEQSGSNASIKMRMASSMLGNWRSSRRSPPVAR